MNTKTTITEAEIKKAWHEAFDQPLYLDHPPGAWDMDLHRIRAVLKLVGVEVKI